MSRTYFEGPRFGSQKYFDPLVDGKGVLFDPLKATPLERYEELKTVISLLKARVADREEEFRRLAEELSLNAK